MKKIILLAIVLTIITTGCATPPKLNSEKKEELALFDPGNVYFYLTHDLITLLTNAFSKSDIAIDSKVKSLTKRTAFINGSISGFESLAQFKSYNAHIYANFPETYIQKKLEQNSLHSIKNIHKFYLSSDLQPYIEVKNNTLNIFSDNVSRISSNTKKQNLKDTFYSFSPTFLEKTNYIRLTEDLSYLPESITSLLPLNSLEVKIIQRTNEYQFSFFIEFSDIEKIPSALRFLNGPYLKTLTFMLGDFRALLPARNSAKAMDSKILTWNTTLSEKEFYNLIVKGLNKFSEKENNNGRF